MRLEEGVIRELHWHKEVLLEYYRPEKRLG
jgi:hypothetical protein